MPTDPWNTLAMWGLKAALSNMGPSILLKGRGGVLQEVGQQSQKCPTSQQSKVFPENHYELPREKQVCKTLPALGADKL